MDKPTTLSVKEWIIRNMSTRINVHERIIETVINHQFSSALDGLTKYDSMEFSGWGKFYFNQKKAKHKMNKYTTLLDIYTNILADESITEQKRRNTELKLKSVTKDISLLKTKLHD